MKQYTTLIFDAFDTVVHINRTKLPLCEIMGQQVRTTAPAVYEAYTLHAGKTDFDAFCEAFSQSSKKIEQIRREHLREVSCHERFALLLRMLEPPSNGASGPLLDILVQSHMKTLETAFEVREETIEFLHWAESRFRRAMISNFDYAPPLYQVLERFGIRSAFETIMVSVEVGWRKPHPLIFSQALEQMNIQAAEALYIGDQLFLDVVGASRSGIDVVWLDGGREIWTEEYPKPTHTVQAIHEVIGILENKHELCQSQPAVDGGPAKGSVE